MRLIDADALNNLMGISVNELFVKYWLDRMPTIDAMPMVRCKDCKWGEIDDPEDFPDQYYCHAGCGWNKGDFFCAYGEKEDGE